MKINWKELAKTEGYISLKAEYIKQVTPKWGRKITKKTKETEYKHFQWVLGRAKHYAYYLSTKTMSIILTEWENKRTYSWDNFYQNYNQVKFTFKKAVHLNRKEKIHKNMNIEKYKNKTRWSMEQKKHQARMKQYCEKLESKPSL